MRGMFRETAVMDIRRRYPDEFESILQCLVVETGKARSALHTKALSLIRDRHRQEYLETVSRLSAEGGVRPVCLVKKPGRMSTGRRKHCDPMDAMILFGRGMNVAEIARYDNCTQTAVLKVLVPQLRKESRRHSIDDMAGRLGTSAGFVCRFLGAV